MAKDIIVRPIISEKADTLASKNNKYVFEVDRKSNKIEIKKAFAKLFPDVTVEDVNTLIARGKTKSRNTRAGILKGKAQTIKKAVITLAEGDTIDIFDSVEE